MGGGKVNKLLTLALAWMMAGMIAYPFWDYFHHRNPAPGYTVVTDGHEWSFKYPSSGRIATYPHWFRQSAINSTWWDYNFDKEYERVKTIKWKDIK
jgi:hypothetical protein